MNSMILRWVALAASLALIGGAMLGCGDGNGAGAHDGNLPAIPAGWKRTATGPIQITATTGQVADLVRQIGAEQVAVTQLMGEGIDPHLYKPSEDDVRKLAAAEAIFYNGLGLEGKMGDLFVRLAGKKPVVAVSERISEDAIAEDDDGHFDPHVWFDPRIWRQAAELVRDVLGQIEPAHKVTFDANAAKLIGDIDAAYAWGQAEIASIPESQRLLITAHDAFRYFGRAFGMDVVGIQGISTDSEAGVKRIEELVKLIVQRKVKAVFVESSVPKKNVEALAEGCDHAGHPVIVIGEDEAADSKLFSDAMGAPGTVEGTYVGMLRHNITLIVKALK